MTRTIISDADMPRSLSTVSKQDARAKKIAAAQSGLQAKSARGTRIQGFFSRTRIVTLVDGTQVVIQFRVEPLNVPYIQKTRQLLGDVVPGVEYLPDADYEQDEIWTYMMKYQPGTPWFVAKFKPAVEITAAKSLGMILARGYTPGDTARIVDKDILPRLQALQTSTNKEIALFRDEITAILAHVEDMKALPLFIAHYDLNKTNILIDDDGHVQGLVDWELAADRPFGFGLHRIHDLAGEISRGEFIVAKHFVDVEKAFWTAVMDGLTPEVRELVMKNLEAVQAALHVGSLLFFFELGDATEYDEKHAERIKTFLSYRLPMLRG